MTSFFCQWNMRKWEFAASRLRWYGASGLLMIAEQSQVWEHVPGEPEGRNYYLEKDVKCWKPALCQEQEGCFYWVKLLKF